MDHHFKGMWGSEGTGDGQFKTPWGIAVDSNGNVYVADKGNHRIQKFNSRGTFLDKWGEEGNGEGQFIFPLNIAIDSKNNIYVTEQLPGVSFTPLRTRIQKFTETGNFIKQWGISGFDNGELNKPLGIAADSDDNILVVDSMNFRIQKFSSQGDFISRWGRYEPGDDRNWHLGAPIDIAVDSNNDYYITDVQHHCVRKFDSSHNFIRKWGTVGNRDGEFGRPNGVATFTGNSILVADTGNHRIQEFSRDGIFINKWGSNGSQPNQFRNPIGVAINKSNGMHYVSDAGNDRIQVFHSDPNSPNVKDCTPFAEAVNEAERLLNLLKERLRTLTIELSMASTSEERQKILKQIKDIENNHLPPAKDNLTAAKNALDDCNRS
jgi:DNA-binding beta-propeller fold protein YncE